MHRATASCLANVACVLAIAIAPGRARAAEGELVLSAEGGHALLTLPTLRAHGFDGHASLWIGLTDTVWLAGSGGVIHHAYSTDDAFTEPRTFWEAFAGVVAAFDVLRTVPFLEVMAGVMGESSVLAPTARFGVGADYFLTPEISLGGVARYRPLPEELGEGLLTLEVRLSWRIEL